MAIQLLQYDPHLEVGSVVEIIRDEQRNDLKMDIENFIQRIKEGQIFIEDLKYIRTNDVFGETLLHIIVRYGLCKNRFQLDGIDIKDLILLTLVQDKKGNTPLHVAILTKEMGSIYALCAEIDADIGLNVQNLEGNTPLHLVSQMDGLTDSCRALSAISLYSERFTNIFPSFLLKNKENKTAFEIVLERFDDEEFHRNFYELYLLHANQSPLEIWYQLQSLQNKRMIHSQLHYFVFIAAISTIEDYSKKSKKSLDISADQCVKDLAPLYDEMITYIEKHPGENHRLECNRLRKTLRALFQQKCDLHNWPMMIDRLNQYRLKRLALDRDKGLNRSIHSLVNAIMECIRIHLNFTVEEFKKFFGNKHLSIVQEKMVNTFYHHWENDGMIVHQLKSGYVQNGYTVAGYIIDKLVPYVYKILETREKEKVFQKALFELQCHLMITIKSLFTLPLIMKEYRYNSFYHLMCHHISEITSVIPPAPPEKPLKKSSRLHNAAPLNEQRDALIESFIRVLRVFKRANSMGYLVREYQLSARLLGREQSLIKMFRLNITRSFQKTWQENFNIQSMSQNPRKFEQAIEKGCLTFMKWLRWQVGLIKMGEKLDQIKIGEYHLSKVKCISQEQRNSLQKDVERCMAMIEYIKDQKDRRRRVDYVREHVIALPEIQKTTTSTPIQSNVEELEVIDALCTRLSLFLGKESLIESYEKEAAQKCHHSTTTVISKKLRRSIVSTDLNEPIVYEVLEHKGQLNGEEYLFEVIDVERDGNCGFTALNLDRNDTINALLKHAGDRRIREIVGPDIIGAFYDQLPSTLEKPKGLEESELKAWSEREDIFRAFLEYYVHHNREWLAFIFNNEGQAIGMIDAIVEIQMIPGVCIWIINRNSEEQQISPAHYYGQMDQARHILYHNDHFKQLRIKSKIDLHYSSENLSSSPFSPLPPFPPPPPPPPPSLPSSLEGKANTNIIKSPAQKVDETQGGEPSLKMTDDQKNEFNPNTSRNDRSLPSEVSLAIIEFDRKRLKKVGERAGIEGGNHSRRETSPLADAIKLAMDKRRASLHS